MTALRKVILANPAPSITIEVRREDASHKVFVLRKRVSRKKQSAAGDKSKPASASKHLGSHDAVDLLETESLAARQDKRHSEGSGRRHRTSGPQTFAPPPLPQSHELSSRGSWRMQFETGPKNRSPTLAPLSSLVPPATPNSGSSASRCEKGPGWLSESPSIGTAGSPSATSSTHRHSSAGEGDGAWESQSQRRDGACGDIDELEKGLACSVKELTKTRDGAEALLLRVAAFKKKMSATARFPVCCLFLRRDPSFCL
jgi:hypothetical protein